MPVCHPDPSPHPQALQALHKEIMANPPLPFQDDRDKDHHDKNLKNDLPDPVHGFPRGRQPPLLSFGSCLPLNIFKSHILLGNLCHRRSRRGQLRFFLGTVRRIRFIRLLIPLCIIGCAVPLLHAGVLSDPRRHLHRNETISVAVHLNPGMCVVIWYKNLRILLRPLCEFFRGNIHAFHIPHRNPHAPKQHCRSGGIICAISPFPLFQEVFHRIPARGSPSRCQGIFGIPGDIGLGHQQYFSHVVGSALPLCIYAAIVIQVFLKIITDPGEIIRNL